MKRLLRWLLSAVFWLTGSLASVILLALFLFQIKSFRQLVYPPIIQLVNTLLIAKLEVSDVHFTGFSSVQVDEARLITEGDTLASVTRVYADLDFLDLLNSRLTIHNVYLQSPRIKLLRNSSTGVWNFERIAKPAPTDTTPSKDFIVNARDVVIDNAKIDFIDSMALKTGTVPAGYWNYSKMQLRDFGIRVAAKELNLTQLTGAAKISGLHFCEANSGMTVNNIDINAKLAKDKVELQKLKIKTPETNLDLACSLSDFYLTKPIDDKALRKALIKLNISHSSISSNDLEKFIYVGLKRNIVLGIDADINGYLNSVDIAHMALKSSNSNLNVTGSFSGLLDGKIFYRANINQSHVRYSDLKKFFPGDVTASIPDFGTAFLRNINAHGTDRNISSRIDLESSLGNAKGTADLVFYPDLKYKANLDVLNCDLSKISGSPSLSSRINCNINADGSGTDLSTMNAKVQMQARGSRFDSYLVNFLTMNAKIENGKILLDTCHFEIPARIGITSIESIMRDNMKVDISGYFNIKNMNHPDYALNAKMNGIDLTDILANPNAPDYLTASLSVAGNGIDPDSMIANAKIDVEELVFKNRSQFPFGVNLDINTVNPTNKSIKIASDLMNIDLEGDFKLAAVSDFGNNLGSYLAKIINDKIEQSINPLYKSEPYYAKMYPANFTFSADVNDIGIINSFLSGQSIYSKFTMMLIGKSTHSESEMDLQNLHIGEFSYQADSLDVHLRNLDLASKILIGTDSAGLSLRDCKINLNESGNGAIGINEMQITEPQFALSVAEDSVLYSVSAVMDKLLALSNSGKIKFDHTVIKLLCDSLLASYADLVHVGNSAPVDLELSLGKLNVKSLALDEAGGIHADVSGGVSLEKFDDLKLNISGINLRKVDTLLKVLNITDLPDINGNITSIAVNANGALINPVYSIAVKTDGIVINDIPAGIFNFNLEYSGRNIHGAGSLNDMRTGAGLFGFQVRSFPIDLAPMPDTAQVLPAYQVPVDLVASSDSLPLAIVSPFLTPVTNLNGRVKLNLQVYGKTIDKLSYSGNLDLPQFDFTLVANNMHYSGKSAIVFDNDAFILKETKVYNDPSDYKGGNATLQGRINMKGFEVADMNFTMNSDGILVLTRNSAKSIPMIYGNLLVSTGDNPIVFKGNMDYMTLNGDINVQRGSLYMPPMTTTTATSTQSSMLYKVIVHDQNGRRYYNVINNATNDTLYSEMPEAEEEYYRRDSIKTEFSNGLVNIKMDLNIKILNPIMLKMDLGAVGQLVAKISSENNSVPLNFYYDYAHDNMKLNGEIELLDGSQLTYIKQFATKGKISFPSGVVYNPTFDLTATYSGKSTVNNRSREFEVYLYVKGPFSNPKISFGYNMDGNDATGDSTQISQDAMFLIVLGRTKSEIEAGSSGGKNNSDLGSLGMSSLSAAFSKTMTQLLGGAGSIESAEIDMSNSNNWQDARIKVSGKLFDNVQWKIGGDLNDITNNSEFSLDIPIDLALHPDYLNNIVWHISRSTNMQQTTMNKNQKEWEVMLKFGGSW